MEIGSDAVAPGTPEDPHDTEAYGNLAQTATWESFDDSPMYNNYERGPAVHPDRYVREPGVRFVYKTGTFNLDLVHENALWALSAECLGKIADELGYKNDAEQFRHEYARMKGPNKRETLGREDRIFIGIVCGRAMAENFLTGRALRSSGCLLQASRTNDRRNGWLKSIC